jgi:hypothetical protein
MPTKTMLNGGAPGQGVTSTNSTKQNNSLNRRRPPLNGEIEDPKSLDEVYRHLHTKYKYMLSMKPEEWTNATDIGRLLLELDEYVFQEMLCFPVDKETTLVYVPSTSGIWELQMGRSELHKSVKDIRQRLQTLIMERCAKAIKLINADMNKCTDDEASKLKHNMQQVSEHYDVLKNLYTKLGTPSFVSGVISSIIDDRVIATKDLGITLNTFNARNNCVAFTDGIYDFNLQRFVSGEDAKKYYRSVHVGYAYEDVLVVDDDVARECMAFISKILPKQHIKTHVLKIFSDSLRCIKMKRFFIHYNLSGSNGKTTLFALVKATFGDLFTRCHNGLLYASQNVAANQSNEELMSIKDKCIIMFSEPNKKQKLSVSFLKDLTGGDDQTARRNYGSKQTFVFYGSPHILCNKIPELEDVDGGVAVRVRCIPYESRFVENANEVDEEQNIYLGDKDVERNFNTWRYVLMRLLIEVSKINVPEPPEVTEHTKKLLERDNAVKTFVDDAIQKTDNKRDILTFSEIYEEYAKRYKKDAMSKTTFEEEIQTVLGAYILKSTKYRKLWRGYKLRFNDICGPSSESEGEL